MYRGVIFALLFLLAPFAVFADTCPSLSLGSSGASVTAIQKILYAAYANFPSPTGTFDATTQAALKQWQKEHGISATGTVGPITGRAMKLCVATPSTVVTSPVPIASPTVPAPMVLSTTRTLYRGLSGTDVTALQQFLISQNLLVPDSATGFFGALTEAAVQSFQRAKGIAAAGTPATTGYGAVGPKTRSVIILAGSAGSVLNNTNGPAVDTSREASVMSPSTIALPSTANTLPSVATAITVPSVPFSGGGGGGGGGGGVFNQPAPVRCSDNPAPSCSNGTLQWQGNDTNGCSRGYVCVANTSPVSAPAPVVSSVEQKSCSFDGRMIPSGKEAVAYPTTVASGNSCTSQVRQCNDGVLTGDPTYTSRSCMASVDTWARDQEANVGWSLTYNCPAGIATSTRLWGTDTYTSDSSVCTAAIHSGVITQSKGGTVTIEIQAQKNVFVGSTRNNITSRSYSSPYGSYIITTTPPATCTLNGQTIQSGNSVTTYKTSSVPVGQSCVSETRVCTDGALSGSYVIAQCSAQLPETYSSSVVTGLIPELGDTSLGNKLNIYLGAAWSQGGQSMYFPYSHGLPVNPSSIGKNGMDTGSLPQNGSPVYVYALLNPTTGETAGILSRSSSVDGVVFPQGFSAASARQLPYSVVVMNGQLPSTRVSGWPNPFIFLSDWSSTKAWEVLSGDSSVTIRVADFSTFVPPEATSVTAQVELRGTGSAYASPYAGVGGEFLLGTVNNNTLVTTVDLPLYNKRVLWRTTGNVQLYLRPMGYQLGFSVPTVNLTTPLPYSFSGLVPQYMDSHTVQIQPGWITSNPGSDIMTISQPLSVNLDHVGINGVDEDLSGGVCQSTRPPYNSSGYSDVGYPKLFTFIAKNPTTGEVGVILSCAEGAANVKWPAGFDKYHAARIPFGLIYSKSEGLRPFSVSHWPQPTITYTAPRTDGSWDVVHAAQNPAGALADFSKFVPKDCFNMLAKVTLRSVNGAGSAYQVQSGGRIQKLLASVTAAGEVETNTLIIPLQSQQTMSWQTTGDVQLSITPIGYQEIDN